ncbi:MAG: prephenate dehydratase [Bryobacter sp.]|jgi:prephenate dehydratase|nr:prephenate dehydratase [Bryobacter sp. CoA8 C33]
MKQAKQYLRAGFQGERGAFSEIAVRQLLGSESDPIPFEWFDGVFHALIEKKIDAAVIPMENTLHGSVIENFDHLFNHDVEVIGETSVRIVHNLIALPGVAFKDVKEVYSHPVALNQCLKFLKDNPRIEKKTFYDTAGSVKMLAETKRRDAAAIASNLAADIYGARILKRGIEDDRANFTRFFLLQRRGGQIKGKMPLARKVSIVFSTRNEPGSLFRALAALALRDISLTKIESRPLKGKPWEYLFYVDFEGSLKESKVQNALRHLEEVADELKVLGGY